MVSLSISPAWSPIRTAAVSVAAAFPVPQLRRSRSEPRWPSAYCGTEQGRCLADQRPASESRASMAILDLSKQPSDGGSILSGKRIVVTRARNQASELARRLRELGAEVIEFPTIAIEPPREYAPMDRAIEQLQ